MGSSGAGRFRSRLRNTLVMMVKSQAFSFVPGLKRFRYRYARKYVSCTRSSASSGFLVRRNALRYSASRCLSKSEKSLLMPTPRWSILFRRIPLDPTVSSAPEARLDPRLDSVRQAVDRALDHDPGAGGADLDRIGGRRTRAVAARLRAADLDADPVRAAVPVLRAAVALIPDAVTGMAGPVAVPVRIRRSPAGRRALAVAGRGVADHPAGDRPSRPEPVRLDVPGVG